MSERPMDPHAWARARMVRERVGILSEDDERRLRAHLESCPECAALASGEPGAPIEPGRHLPASLIAEWPRARALLRGLERALVRRHLERCAECRQDLELLGHAAALDPVPELETTALDPGAEPTAMASPPPSLRAIPAMRDDAGTRGRRLRDRALVAWASLATAAAVIAIVVVARRPVLEGVPGSLALEMSPPVAGAPESHGGPSVHLAPRPRSLSSPARGGLGGKVTVIPVIGPVPRLVLAVRPLDLPDTSWVQVSLVRGDRDTMLTVLHRQWEFLPKRMLVIDGGDAPLEPGRYALVLTGLRSEVQAGGPSSRYLFELRPRPR
jgi:hypothetical protein